jgi:tetratricopeptide (TPR) repeat protein
MKLQWKVFSIVFVLAGFATTLLPQTSQSESPTLTLERARKLEVVDGNLEEAMKVYKSLVDNYSTVRPLRADALAGLGRSYQKTGDFEEARNLYARVLKDYPDQKDAVAQVTARLASLGVTVTGKVTPSEARFVFALPQRPRWEWYRPSTPLNEMEYNWGIGVENGGKNYGAGFLLFKAHDAMASGKIGDLLRAGQMSVFQSTGDGGGSVVQTARVYASASGNWLTISVTDPSTLKLLFSGKPSHAEFSSKFPGQSLREGPVESKGKIPIVYEGF